MAISKVEGTVPVIEAAIRKALRGLSAALYAAANDLDGRGGAYLIEARDEDGGTGAVRRRRWLGSTPTTLRRIS